MNAKETIKHMNDIADYLAKAANHDKYYNTEGSHFLAMAAQTLYQESRNIQYVQEYMGLPQCDELDL